MRYLHSSSTDSRKPRCSVRTTALLGLSLCALWSCGDTSPTPTAAVTSPPSVAPVNNASAASAVTSVASPPSSTIQVDQLNLDFPDKMAREPALFGDPAQLFLHSENGTLLADLVGQTWIFQNEAPAHLPNSLADGILHLEDLPSITASSGSFASLRNGLVLEDGQLSGWAPDFDHDRHGNTHLVFDRADHGDFNVYYREPSGETIALAQSTRFEAHASIACDTQDRVWIAWDEGAEAWGHADGLHVERQLKLVVREQGVWKKVPLPPLDTLLAPADWDDQAPQASCAELPRLVVAENGELWMFFRVMRIFPRSASRLAARVVAWEIRAMALGQSGWSEVITLPHSEGPNHDTLAVVPHPEGGVLATWTSDRRRERFVLNLEWHKRLMRNARVYTAHLQSEFSAPLANCSANWKPFVVEPESTSHTEPPAWAVDPNPQLVPPGLQRLWGDLHRHSDISRCKIGEDGSVIDQFRYARGVAALDFLALTDHIQHMSKSVWGFEMAMSERFQQPQQFSTLFGFERAMPGGHRNMITPDPELARTGPFFDGSDQEALEFFSHQHIIAIPHQLSDRTALLHWKHHIPALETLIEIFQGRRGSYEAPNAPRLDLRSDRTAAHAIDYLEQGRRFGFIASSDHVSSGNAFAAVLAEENTRDSIFDAMQKRRAYAATAKIALDVRLGKLQMGEAGVVDVDTPLHIRVDAGSAIARIDVIRSGEITQSWHGHNEPDQEWQNALLSVRLLGSRGATNLELRGDDLRFGSAHGYDNELNDSSQLQPEKEWPLLLAAQLESGDSDGWMIPIQVRTGNDSPQLQTMLDGETAVWPLADLGNGPQRKRLAETQLALEVHPAPLGERTFQVDWTPHNWLHGDWVYVRVMRTDGAMAWSSPIWVEDS